MIGQNKKRFYSKIIKTMDAVLSFVKKNQKILLTIVAVIAIALLLNHFGYITIMREAFEDSAVTDQQYDPSDPAAAQMNGAPLDEKREQREGEQGEQGHEGFESSDPSGPEPKGCAPHNAISPAELLPKTDGSLWAQMNPMGQGSLQERNFLTAGHHMGITTVGSVMRNANLQLRSEPPNPQVKVSPWNQSTVEPDISRRPLEIGGCA